MMKCWGTYIESMGKDQKVSTTGKAGGLISPKRAALLATLKAYPSLGITL